MEPLNCVFVTIKETNDWKVEYDVGAHGYRISYFNDGHFVDDITFDEYSNDIIGCPHCRVCSISLLAANGADSTVCKVCGNTVDLHKFKG